MFLISLVYFCSSFIVIIYHNILQDNNNNNKIMDKKIEESVIWKNIYITYIKYQQK